MTVPGFESRVAEESAGEGVGDDFSAEAGSQDSGQPEFVGALAGLPHPGELGPRERAAAVAAFPRMWMPLT